MTQFLIEPHFRLHEWIAHELGFFHDEGLEYEFRETVRSSAGKVHDTGDKQGAMQSLEAGRKADISCACHWTVNVAAAKGHGRLYGEAYSVAPCGIFVPADSEITSPEQLAEVPVSVGYQSGSHYATVQALEQFLPSEQIALSFKDGMLFGRMEKFLDRLSPACTLFSGPYYFAEQLGFRKLLDCTFMIAAMIHGEVDDEDIRKYYRGLNRAQTELDLRHERYTHYYVNEFPERFHQSMDTRRWGPGERIVFEPYSRETFESTRAWIGARGIFEDGDLGALGYERAVARL